MDYISTRGTAPVLSFADVTLAGLASDGGLYVPRDVPRFSEAEIASFASLSYPQLALRVLTPFIGDDIPAPVLEKLLTEAYANFRHPEIAPLKKLGENEYLLELFHGPTLAFKDFALQFLGRLMEYLLNLRGESATVIGATSGDTGSAAIAGFAGRGNMRIFILHPQGRVSDVQRRQMTTVADSNVYNLAVRGTFDDCQDIVKALFADHAFRASARLVAVNSINWARILAQVVYYFYAALKLGAPKKAVSFSVPTGNFGDIYAGHIARRMGLNVGQLIIATNRNDILTRCLKQGEYRMEGVHPSLSPSMDIQVSSNFERLLFELHDCDGARMAQMMQDFRRSGTLALSPDALTKLRAQFSAGAADDERTKQTIAEIHRSTGEIIDPHTAVGVAAGRDCWQNHAHPLVTLATAHPAKFPDAVIAACGVHPQLPPHLSDLMQRHERFDVIENSDAAVRDYIIAHP